MVIHVVVQYNGGFLPGTLLLTQAPIFVWFDDTIIVYYYYYIVSCFVRYVAGGHVAINLSVQLYNGGLLPDILLLTQGYNHRGTRLNAMYVCRGFKRKIRTRLDLLSIPQSGGKICQNV